jgi:hypothetical protein
MSAMIVALAAWATPALADPVKLSDTQLDNVAAGLGADWSGPPGVRPRPIIPPIVNPGGPILISCTVGVGCTTRHYP